MISRDMYRLLKRIPRWPKNKTLKELRKTWFMDDMLVANLLDEAVSRGYVVTTGKDPAEIFKWRHHLSEEGREAMEEYSRSQSSSRLSKIAIVLSVIGLLISIATFLGWGVQ